MHGLVEPTQGGLLTWRYMAADCEESGDRADLEGPVVLVGDWMWNTEAVVSLMGEGNYMELGLRNPRKPEALTAPTGLGIKTIVVL